MIIRHIIDGLPKAAGTTVFVENVVRGLRSRGHIVQLVSHGGELETDCQCPDVIHLHALWAPLLHGACKWANYNGVPIVWSPHGMLTPWAMNNKRWKKLAAWCLYQRRDLSNAALLHATAQSEVDDLRRLGLKNKVVIAPLGVDIHDRIEHIRHINGKKTLLFVSRVQRKKGLENLVKAWVLLPSAIRSKWTVRVVGPDQEGHTDELKELCARLVVENDFEFVGPRYGDDLAREYASADLFVLPTHSENFGSVVIEALEHRVPVICTKGAPWEELETHECGWWIDIGAEPLAMALKNAMTLADSKRLAMGERGRKLVEEKYTWEAVVKRLEQAYEGVLNAST